MHFFSQQVILNGLIDLSLTLNYHETNSIWIDFTLKVSEFRKTYFWNFIMLEIIHFCTSSKKTKKKTKDIN